MSEPAPTYIRPRSGTELIDAAFVLLRGHYPRLIALAALPFLPYIVLSLSQAIRFGADPQGALFLEQVFVYFACTGVAHGAVAVAVSQIYHGRPLDTAEALRRTLARLWVVVAATVVALSLIGVGMVLFIVPGVLLFTQYFAIPIVTVLEGTGFVETFRRSGELARGHRKLILVSYGLTWVIITAITAAIELVIGGGLMMTERPILLNLVGNTITVLTYPAIATVATLAYYETRIRAEAYDLEVLAGAVASPEDPRYAPGQTAP